MISWLRILVKGRVYDTPTNKIICIYSKRDSETNFYSYGRHPDMNYIQHTSNIYNQSGMLTEDMICQIY